MATSLTGLSTNFFPSAQNGFTTTLASTIASGATTVPLNSVAGYTNGQIAVFVVDPSDATKKQTFTGVIDTAGVQVTSVVWTAGTNQTHTAGATVVDYATATHISMMTKGLLINHGQEGGHKTLTDANGNEWIERGQTAAAVNQVKISNAATTGKPTIEANGDDASITLDLKPKGASGFVEVLDHNGNEVLKAGVGTASAVNEVTVTNAATGNAPTIASTGGDTNTDLRLVPKGTGNVKRGATGGSIDWWEEIGRTTLGVAGDTITVSSLPSRKYLWVIADCLDTAGTIDLQLRLNGDTGSNYAFRHSQNGGADGTAASVALINVGTNGVLTAPIHADIKINNIATKEKLIIGEAISRGTGGAANNVTRGEFAGKWADITNVVSSVTIFNPGAGDYAIGSEVIVLGHD